MDVLHGTGNLCFDYGNTVQSIDVLQNQAADVMNMVRIVFWWKAENKHVYTHAMFQQCRSIHWMGTSIIAYVDKIIDRFHSIIFSLSLFFFIIVNYR